jgi:2-keto-3-deoxy-L-fuconate dehydrogenase
VFAAAEAVGAVDVLFNCAGFVHHGTILDCDDKAWDFSMNLNVRSMFWVTQALLPAMIAKGKGSIVNMSSGASSIKGAPNRFVYGTTKAAVIGLTKALAADHVRQGIRVNAICPGVVDTAMPRRYVKDIEDKEGAFKQMAAMHLMNRLAEPIEIVNVALFLASDEASYMTGAVIPVDGGLTAI